MKVEIYSDVVCPWCYIGERRFFQALESHPGGEEVEVVFRAYQLDPNAPEEAVPLREYLRDRFGAGADGMRDRLDEVAAGEGITIDWDAALAANTRTAHRLLVLARWEHGSAVQRALAERLFDFHFTRGGDLGDQDALVELAAAVGIDGDHARRWLDSDAGAAEVAEDILSARELGIRGVPTFVFDGEFAVQGAQEVSTFRRALDHGRANRSATESAHTA